MTCDEHRKSKPTKATLTRETNSSKVKKGDVM